jgi:hypothetical protein
MLALAVARGTADHLLGESVRQKDDIPFNVLVRTLDKKEYSLQVHVFCLSSALRPHVLGGKK